MSNGPIIELSAIGDQDFEVIDKEEKSSLFDFDSKKINKYSKGNFFTYSQGNPNWGNTIRFDIERKGDLLYGLYVKLKLPALSVSNLNTPIHQDPDDPNCKYRVKYVDFIGNVIIEKASLYINGQLIDELDGEYMQCYNDLYISDSNRQLMLGFDEVINKPNLEIPSEYIYVPLNYWFGTDIAKPLPIIALQNSEIYVDIKFRNFNDCVMVLEENQNVLYHSNIVHKQVNIGEASLLANYYFASLEERYELATKSYEILITQSQVRSTNIGTNATLEINFNNVVKDIIFYIQPEVHKKVGEFFNFTNKLKYPLLEFSPVSKLWELEVPNNLLKKARILFNGMERLEWRDAKYFSFVQNYENYRSNIKNRFYMYSFDIFPKKDYKSGCNFSRIDNAQLQVEIKPNPFVLNKNPLIKYPTNFNYELKCYATSYNTLIIKNGLAGLKYTC